MSLACLHIILTISLLCVLPYICMAKSVLLTADDPSGNGATVELIKGVTSYAPFEWDLYAMDETEFNMKIHLNNEWSFHPQYPTTLTLQIDSDTLSDITETDTALIVSFSQNNAKYITSVIQIGAAGINNDHLIYPPPYDGLGKQIYGDGNIEQLVSSKNNENIDRVSALTNNGSYGYFNPFTELPNISYPLTFTLQNDPYLNRMIFTYTNPSVKPRHIVYYGMDTNQTFDIYLSAADTGDNFDITSFNITHSITSAWQPISPNTNTNTTEIIMQSTQYKHHIDWFKTSLVIILISTILILFCLCCLFGVMFTKILKNHKKMIQTHQSKQRKHSQTDDKPNTIKSVSNNIPVKKEEHIVYTIDSMNTITPPSMAKILSVSSPISQNTLDLNVNENHPNSDINNIYQQFTRDRLKYGETHEIGKNKNDKTIDDDSEDMYDVNIICKQTSMSAKDNGEQEEEKKDMQPIKYVANTQTNLSLNLNDIQSGISVAEGTLSPYRSPTLQYASPPAQTSITPYAIDEYPVTLKNK